MSLFGGYEYAGQIERKYNFNKNNMSQSLFNS